MACACIPPNQEAEAENCLNPGGRGYSEPRSRHCTPAWVTGQDCVSKKKKRRKQLNKYAWHSVFSSCNGNNLKSIGNDRHKWVKGWVNELFLQLSNSKSKQCYSVVYITDLCFWLISCSNYDNQNSKKKARCNSDFLGSEHMWTKQDHCIKDK